MSAWSCAGVYPAQDTPRQISGPGLSCTGHPLTGIPRRREAGGGAPASDQKGGRLMAPQSGNPPSYTAATEEDRTRRLAEVHGRLSTAMDNASTFGAFVDPRVLVELRDVVGEVLELIGDRPGCRYACRDRGFHCPISDPLDREVAPAAGVGLDRLLGRGRGPYRTRHG